MGKWYRYYQCENCKHKIEEENASAWRLCPKCESRMYDLTHTKQRVIDVPLKGSKEYYEKRWFRRNEKEWHDDIRSRRMVNDKVVRIKNDR